MKGSLKKFYRFGAISIFSFFLPSLYQPCFTCYFAIIRKRFIALRNRLSRININRIRIFTTTRAKQSKYVHLYWPNFFSLTIAQRHIFAAITYYIPSNRCVTFPIEFSLASIEFEKLRT